MRLNWHALQDRAQRLFPDSSVRRKMMILLGVILLFEGVSVIILYSYKGLAVGFLSLIIGILILALIGPFRYSRSAPVPESESQEKALLSRGDPLGIRLVDGIIRRIDDKYVIVAAGLAIVALVVVWNMFFSPRREFGDLDTLSVIFGGLIAVYPWLYNKYKVEATFSIIFLGLVVLLLVVPQAVLSVWKGGGSSASSWYVHYMLAAPFSGILQLIGIESSATGNLVMVQFSDGTRQLLGISAYCAGLYSFSIFLSAFISFVLVFERLSNKMLALVLGIGLLIAYLGNLLRMVVIAVVGYYYGIEALLWAHENAGWVIFLSWSAVFWYVLLRFISKRSVSGTAAIPGKRPEAD